MKAGLGLFLPGASQGQCSGQEAGASLGWAKARAHGASFKAKQRTRVGLKCPMQRSRYQKLGNVAHIREQERGVQRFMSEPLHRSPRQPALG